jgi:hypothetical protein
MPDAPPDGTLITVVENARLVQAGAIEATKAITDVTIRKRAELQLYEAKKSTGDAEVIDAVITAMPRPGRIPQSGAGGMTGRENRGRPGSGLRSSGS